MGLCTCGWKCGSGPASLGRKMRRMREKRSSQRRFDLHTEDPASSELARDINRDIVLELLRRKQPIARVELARLSGLQRSTVSLIVEQLLEERWIVEGATVRTARGRRPTMLSLNADLVILTVDVRPSHAVCAVVDLNGHFLGRQSVPIAADPEVGVLRIAEVLQQFRTNFERKTVEGIGVSLPAAWSQSRSNCCGLQTCGGQAMTSRRSLRRSWACRWRWTTPPMPAC